MKFNLKNFPKLYKNCMTVFYKDTKRWKEGFDAEVRERMAKTKSFLDNLDRKNQPIMYNYYKGNYDEDKEILGE